MDQDDAMSKECEAMEVDVDSQDEEYSTVSETSCNTNSSSSSACQGGTSDEKSENEPQDKIKSVAAKTEHGPKSHHHADHAAKLNYLFRDCRFFLMKSCNNENISLAKVKGLWSTFKHTEEVINDAVQNCRNVILVFSAERSGKFSGFARLRGTARYDMVPINWVLSQDQSRDGLGGIFKLDWISRLDLGFEHCGHLYNELNESRPVKIGRNGQEIEYEVGKQLCRLFPKDEGIELTLILYRSKRTANELAHKRALAAQLEAQRIDLRGRGKQADFHFANRQRPYKRRDERPRVEERPNWPRRDEENVQPRAQFVRGRWSVVYNRYLNCSEWRFHVPTNYTDRRHARVMNRREENIMHRGQGRNQRQGHRGRGGFTHAGGYRERWLHTGYRHPYKR